MGATRGSNDLDVGLVANKGMADYMKIMQTPILPAIRAL
jgi:hypothetical protein